MEILIIIGCVVFAFLVEYIYNKYLDTLPKDKREELKKMQSGMYCPYCKSDDFEIVGLKRHKAIFQCRHCKRIR